MLGLILGVRRVNSNRGASAQGGYEKYSRALENPFYLQPLINAILEKPVYGPNTHRLGAVLSTPMRLSSRGVSAIQPTKKLHAMDGRS